jgi:hypothetical protein
MDPQRTLWQLLAAYNSNDRQQIDEYLGYLQEWNKKGGFQPTIQARYAAGIESVVYIVTSKSKDPKA